MSTEGTTEHTETPPKKFNAGKWIKRLIKLTLILAVALFIGLTVLANIGGKSPILHDAVEELISQQTGYSTKVGTFNGMRFFPNIAINVENIEMSHMLQTTQATGETTAEAYGDVMITVEKAHVVMGFFDTMLGKGQIKVLEINNIRSAPKALLSQAVHIERIALGEGENEKGALTVNGTIGEMPLNASIDFDMYGTPENRKYDVGSERNISATIGDVNITAMLSDIPLSSGVKITDMIIMDGEKKAMNVDATFKYSDTGKTTIDGTVILQPHNSTIMPDLKIENKEGMMNVRGSIKSDVLNIADLDANSRALRTINKLMAVIAATDAPKNSALDLGGQDIELDIDIKKLMSDKVVIGDVKAPVKVLNSILNIGPLSGKISGGQLKGSVTLDAAKVPAELTTNATIKGFDYAALQRQFKKDADIEGTADIAVNLTSKAKGADDLVKNLKGDLTIITADGKMRSNLLNVWGGGLLNTMLPKFGENKDLNLNCAVIDLDIDNQTLKTNALFVDTHRITLTGEGQYKMDTDRLDMKLSPKTKDVALLDVATAVHVKGPLSNLSVTPSALDITKKVGGLLLGAVNPAFYAVTLVDLGLNDKHPCKQYIIEKEELPAPKTDTKTSTKPDAPIAGTNK